LLEVIGVSLCLTSFVKNTPQDQAQGNATDSCTLPFRRTACVEQNTRVFVKISQKNNVYKQKMI